MIDTSELDRKEFRAAYVKLEYALHALMRVNVDNAARPACDGREGSACGDHAHANYEGTQHCDVIVETADAAFRCNCPHARERRNGR